MATTFCRLEDAVFEDNVDPREGKDGHYWTSTYGFDGADSGTPQAFLVRLFTPQIGAPHFHPVDQFQIFFPADGATYLRSPIEHPVVHYTDAYSTYGPFAAGDPWFEFYTLRARPTDEIMWMPEERHLMRKRGQRNLHQDLGPSVIGAPPGPGQAVSRSVLDETDDHMSAVFVAAAPGAPLPTTSAVGTSGRYHCVLSGELVFDGRVYGPRSLGWSDAGSDAPELTAGPDGVEVLVLTFPFPSTEAIGLDGTSGAASNVATSAAS
jgi:hypothetical protein